MPGPSPVMTLRAEKSLLDRALSLCADVRAGEGTTAVLMLINIFVLLVCYSVIKTVREPLILLGGGAEVRSYAAAGQALLLMGFVPLYSWFVSRVDRAKLLVGVTLFFVVCIELFASAVAAGVPYVGIAFFIWVGIFNISLVAQFWSFANDIYSKESGARLFPIIVIGMTAGAPLGSFVSARLFRLGFHPQSILQISALLLAASVVLYLWINSRDARQPSQAQPTMSSSGGFRLVLGSGHLRMIAALIVLLNVVNTTGEYAISRLLTDHVNHLALVDPTLDRQAFIGTYAGEYQLWVNVTAFLLQAFVASRLVRHRGLAGVLLALPLIALGGYSIIAAGAGFALVRWIKTAENATDYSIMNTARQLLWLPTTRDEKYKAKQAIDTFFVRGGDVLSAAAVYAGTSILHLSVAQFAGVNIVLTLAWLTIALRIAHPQWTLPRLQPRRLAAAAAAVVVIAFASPTSAQDTREAQLAAERAEKATRLHPYEPTTTERRILMVEHALRADRPVYAFIGSAFDGGGLAIGPGYRARFAPPGPRKTTRSLTRSSASPTLRTVASRSSWMDTGWTRRRWRSTAWATRRAHTDRISPTARPTSARPPAFRRRRSSRSAPAWTCSPSTRPTRVRRIAGAACSPGSTGEHRPPTRDAAASTGSIGPTTTRRPPEVAAASVASTRNWISFFRSCARTG